MDIQFWGKYIFYLVWVLAALLLLDVLLWDGSDKKQVLLNVVFDVAIIAIYSVMYFRESGRGNSVFSRFGLSRLTFWQSLVILLAIPGVPALVILLLMLLT